MKKILFTVLTIVLLFGFTVSAEARVDRCYWIWSTANAGANDGPDAVYCSVEGNRFVGGTAMAGYIQRTAGAYSVQISWDSLFGDNSNTIGDLNNQITDTTVICSSTATDWDINMLACDGSVCDTGTGALAYYQKNDLSADQKSSFMLTPVADGFKITTDGDTGNACPVIRTTVTW